MAAIRSTLTSHDLAFAKAPAAKAPVAKRAAGPGWFARAFTVFQQARLRQAEREVARYLGGAGAKFTDETEREIERRFLSNNTRL